VCDLVPARNAEFVTKWGTRWPDARTFTDYKQMLAETSPTILSVVTPDHRHADIVVTACEMGVRGIFCEKPIATTLADADRIIAACRTHNVVLSIDHTRRWRQIWHQARNLVRSGNLGPLRRIVATLAGPRAMLFRNATHLVDTVNFFAESEPVWVMADLDDIHSTYGPRYVGDGGHDPATDPGASAYIRYENGVRAFICANKDGVMRFELLIDCEHGRITIDDTAGAAEVSQIARGAPMGEGATGPARVMRWTLPGATVAWGALEGGLREVIAHVEAKAAGVAAPAALVSTGEDARRTLSILLGILQSHQAGNAKVAYPIADA
jgi:predicted dehydrogenase